MRIDPTAALRRWSIDVDIAGGTYTIPPLPAADWITAVQDGWLAIVPGLLENADHLDDLIADGQLSYDDCRRAAQDALAAAAGTKWWTATRLVGWVLHERIAGRLALKGVDPSQVTLAGLFLAAYETVASSVEKAKLAQLEMELDRPPQGVPVEEWYDPAEAEAAFMAVMAADG